MLYCMRNEVWHCCIAALRQIKKRQSINKTQTGQAIRADSMAASLLALLPITRMI